MRKQKGNLPKSMWVFTPLPWRLKDAELWVALLLRDHPMSGHELLAACEKEGLKLDLKRTAQLLATLGSGFGGGMARMREVCGTVSAMAMLSGLKKGFTDPEDLEGKAEAYALVRRMSDALKAEHGSILCRELLGLPEGVEREDSARPQERTPEYYASRPCSGIVRTAARIVETQLLPDIFSEEN